MALKARLRPFSAQSRSSADASLQTLSAKSAAALDRDLMGVGSFSLDQLMELAGLSVSQAGMPLHDTWQTVAD